ncbi:hypothetical protein Syun_023728 [Stephania yunnanensis]|uniref:Uncharacterized protein n=1 Tax=Stephania yunnanensis TaxID=152371 RepID=A0AAP0FJE6_9MAGN
MRLERGAVEREKGGGEERWRCPNTYIDKVAQVVIHRCLLMHILWSTGHKHKTKYQRE